MQLNLIQDVPFAKCVTGLVDLVLLMLVSDRLFEVHLLTMPVRAKLASPGGYAVCLFAEC